MGRGRGVGDGGVGGNYSYINFQFESRDELVKNVNTSVGLGDGIVQRSQAVYETISGSIDPIVGDNEQITEIGTGTLMGNNEHKLQVNFELTHLKRKVPSLSTFF